MTPRDALLAAVLADPANDTPRLAFADWCDENGEEDREPTLRYLDLRYSGLGPADAVALARCPALRGLMFLKLEGNPIGSEGAAALAAADWPRLASLELHSCGIGEDGAAAFASAEMPELQRLDLAINGQIGPGGCRALAGGRFPQLRHLGVKNCGVDPASLAELRRRFGDGVRGL